MPDVVARPTWPLQLFSANLGRPVRSELVHATPDDRRDSQLVEAPSRRNCIEFQQYRAIKTDSASVYIPRLDLFASASVTTFMASINLLKHLQSIKENATPPQECQCIELSGCKPQI